MSTRGVIYYNTGTGCAVRLLVSLFSLRRHYQGPVAILSEGEPSDALCKRIGKALDASVIAWESGVAPGSNYPFLAKTRCHLGTPFEASILLDSDTLILGGVDELFELAEEHSFCVAQFSNWQSMGRTIVKRIQQWKTLLPNDVQSAIDFGPAINTGVLAFAKEAPIYQDWYRLAVQGREFFIPDEVCCQIILHRYPHRILDGSWNRSCKYDDPNLPDTRIIHYHGRKHCRPRLPYHGDKWMAMFDEVMSRNIAGVREWQPAGDRMLRKYLRNTNTPAKSGDTDCQRIVVGAGKTSYDGWRSTERDSLDVTKAGDWERVLEGRKLTHILAEHVWEHLPRSLVALANSQGYEHLCEGGRIRIAVPDGLNPDPRYIEHVRPGGTGPAAKDHQILYDCHTLSRELTVAGFQVELLEYWDERGVFHHKPWVSEDGHIKRSALHDRRNRKGRLRYTSLIVDAWRNPSKVVESSIAAELDGRMPSLLVAAKCSHIF